MARFLYKAVDRQGNELTSHVDAVSKDAAEEFVRKQGLFLLELKAERLRSSKQHSSWKTFFKNLNYSTFRFSQKVPARLVASTTRQLGTLLRSGMPLLQSLRVLSAQQKQLYFKHVLNELALSVEGGASFSDAMQAFPGTFSMLYVSMVRAGEAGGCLDDILLRLAGYLEQSHEFKGKVKYALIYPALIVFVALMVVGLLLVYVIPQFKRLFSELHADLPVSTKMLIYSSEFVQNYGWALVIVLGVLWVGYRLARRVSGIRMFLDRIYLLVPVFGVLLGSIEVVRFSRLLGTLLLSGVPILRGLDIVRSAAGNAAYRHLFSDAVDAVREGESLAEVFAPASFVPPVMVNMIHVGEESGALGEMLLNVADIYESDVRHMVDALIKMIEPFLIVFIAFLVGGVVVAMFSPLITLMSALGQ